MEDLFEGIYLNNYKFEKFIRGDSHCAVFQGVNLKSARKVAIKSFFLNEIHPKFTDFIRKDLIIYSTIENPNVLKIEEYFESNAHGFLVYEYCNDHTLEDYWMRHKKEIKERKLIKITRQIFNGFKALLEKNIFTRDYRLRNILINENKIKVGDCLSFVNKGSFLFHNQREYLAPEVLEEGEDKSDSAKADLWSIGVAIYKLVYGKSPFQGVTDLLLLKDINKNIDNNLEGLFANEKIKNNELFEDLLRKIFKHCKERHVKAIFKEELLTKKFIVKQFADDNDDFSLRSCTEKKEIIMSLQPPLIQSAPTNNLTRTNKNPKKLDEGIENLPQLKPWKSMSKMSCQSIIEKNEKITGDLDHTRFKENEEKLEDVKEVASLYRVSKELINEESGKKNILKNENVQKQKNVFPGCNLFCSPNDSKDS